MDFPAPLEPISATASFSFTVKETPASALSVAREIGCNKARQPVKAGGKYFSSAVTEMAGAGIYAVITEFACRIQLSHCRVTESAGRIDAGRVAKLSRHGAQFELPDLPAKLITQP